MRIYLTVVAWFCVVAVTGCRSPVDPAARTMALTTGNTLYMAVLDHQMTRWVMPSGQRRVILDLPKSEDSQTYARALATLYPGVAVVTQGAPAKAVTLSIKGIRRTGALIGEVFGGVTMNGTETIHLHYLGTGLPVKGQQSHWKVVRSDPWPKNVPQPIRKR